MSENETKIEEQPQSSCIMDSTAIPIGSSEANKMNDNDGLQSLASEKPNDVSDKGSIVELKEPNPVEMEPKLDEVQQSNTENEQEKVAPMVDTVISNPSVCIDMTPTKETIQQKSHPITSSIGSLGLLNQYASSSDDDEDSSDSSSGSSSSSSDSSDSESDDDDDSSEASNNVQMNTSNVTNENQLNALANNILNDAMSRSNYRDVSSDT